MNSINHVGCLRALSGELPALSPETPMPNTPRGSHRYRPARTVVEGLVLLIREHQAYLRSLPGRGFVAIKVAPAFSLFQGRHYRGSLIVERRAPWRRPGHRPPVIAEATGKSIASVIQHLFPSAECDPAIGAAVLRMQRLAEDECASGR